MFAYCNVINYHFGFRYMFASASPDNIKQWKCPEGKFIQNLNGHNAIIECMAANSDGVLVSGANNGSIHLWDWRTGYNFQRLQVKMREVVLDFIDFLYSGSSATRINGF